MQSAAEYGAAAMNSQKEIVRLLGKDESLLIPAALRELD